MGSAKTNYLKATGFSFVVPATATISEVLVKVRKKATGVLLLGNYVTDESVKLVIEGSITEYSQATTHWPTSNVAESYSFKPGNGLTLSLLILIVLILELLFPLPLKV